jgi:hypothetical protein
MGALFIFCDVSFAPGKATSESDQNCNSNPFIGNNQRFDQFNSRNIVQFIPLQTGQFNGGIQFADKFSLNI